MKQNIRQTIRKIIKEVMFKDNSDEVVMKAVLSGKGPGNSLNILGVVNEEKDGTWSSAIIAVGKNSNITMFKTSGYPDKETAIKGLKIKFPKNYKIIK